MEQLSQLPLEIVPIILAYHPLFCRYQRVYQLYTYRNGKIHSVRGITPSMYTDLGRSRRSHESQEIVCHHRCPWYSQSIEPFLVHVFNRYLETNTVSDSED